MKKIVNTQLKKSEFDIVVIGEINADLILKGNVVPCFGQVEQIVDDAELVVGSSAVIFAFGAARLGLRTTFIGKVGNDLFGKFMIDAMSARGVDTRNVIIDPSIRTGLSVILTKQNDRAILTYLGSIPALNFDDINFDCFSRCRHLHLSSYFLLDNLRPGIPELFQNVKKMGLSISLDTNYDPAEIWDDGLTDAIKHVDLLLVNETEARAISGKGDLFSAIDKLTQNVPIVAIKQGRDGAMVKFEQSSVIQQNVIKVDVVDTVGAGDSFDAGFIYGYLNQWEPKKMLKLAVACGSLSTRKAGGTEAQPELKEILQVMKTL